ncbi:anion transporter [Candidatus Woesearchaeota archaeon]|nr:anion transporter [Candidatus Woesearchaeota archaeon]
MILPIIILAGVLLLTAVRQVGRIKLEIWQIMLLGAAAVLITGQISPERALQSINIDVMIFLLCMFIVGQAMEESGLLENIAYKMFRKAESTDGLLLIILFAFGAASAFFMNDTLAIIGTPVMLGLARKNALPSKLLLLTLAFAITIGGVMSPIGNPQNFLIAVNANIPEPFVTFLARLFIPTMINLLLAYVLLKAFYGGSFRKLGPAQPEPLRDLQLARISMAAVAIMLVLVAAKVALTIAKPEADFKLTYIALAAALPILVFSSRRLQLAKKVDWRTMAFFAAMFILTSSAWESGFFQSAIRRIDIPVTSTMSILTISVLLSQLISNVPLAALYLPVLMHAGAQTSQLIALAAGSTIAGNLFILGAASNIIIIQTAERKNETLTFTDFARVGIPLTIANVLVYWIFLR